MRAPVKRTRKSNRKRPDSSDRRGRAGGALRFVGRLIGAVAVVSTVFAAVIGIYLWATTSPRLAVTEVRIQGNHRATLDELAPLTGVRRGTNIFLVDRKAAERRLTSHPWVRSAVVRKEPPGRVSVAVREYEPAALVVLGSMYLADPEGTVFKQAAPAEALDLPIFSGIDPEEDEEHRRSEIVRGLEIVSLWERAGLPDEPSLSQIHLDPLRGSILTAVRPVDGEERALVIHMAESDLPARLSRLSSLLEVLSERGEQPKEIFLDNRTRPQWVVARVDE